MASFFDEKKNGISVKGIFKKSNKQVWFKCLCGNAWKETVWSMVRRAEHSGMFCKKCRLKLKSAGARFPYLVEDWDEEKNGISIFDVMGANANKFYWKNQETPTTIQNKIKHAKYKEFRNNV